ncbi:MAG TPA: hypothetical protein VLK23_03130 [Thermodesulfobacteriota bacterium]|nr:hypothetical protein [Thermodesulfobacteriota bacterium]
MRRVEPISLPTPRSPVLYLHFAFRDPQSVIFRQLLYQQTPPTVRIKTRRITATAVNFLIFKIPTSFSLIMLESVHKLTISKKAVIPPKAGIQLLAESGCRIMSGMTE